MRKHLLLITEEPKNPELVGNVSFADRRSSHAKKNAERASLMRDTKNGERWERKVVGLGYVDFEDEDDYRSRAGEAARRKLREIDDEHLEKAGIDPTEIEGGER